MYLFEPTSLLYYEITNMDGFIEYIDTKDIIYIKTLFKASYQEKILQDSIDSLNKLGLLKIKLEKSQFDLTDAVEFFKNYIIERYGESVYKIIEINFNADFDFRMRTIANPSMLN